MDGAGFLQYHGVNDAMPPARQPFSVREYFPCHGLQPGSLERGQAPECPELPQWLTGTTGHIRAS